MASFRKFERRSTQRRTEGRSEGFGRRSERGFSRRSEGFGSRPEGRLELFDVTCAKCGKETKVPFRPSGSKPVYCRDCFSREEGREFLPKKDYAPRREYSPRKEFSPRREVGRSGPDKFDKINEKLDKIMKALGIE